MDRPLRFCMITTFYPPYHFGGDAVFVQQLSNELAMRGHQVDVVHCKDAYYVRGGQQPSTTTYRDHPNVTVHTLESPLGFFSPLLTHQTGRPILNSRRLKKILEKPFDIIHYHNISLVGGPKVLEYGSGIKLYTLHEYWLVCPTHMLFKFNREACSNPQCVSCTLIHRRPLQLWRYTGMVTESVKHIDLFFAPTEFAKRKHIEMGLNAPIVELPYFTSRWPCPEARTRSSKRHARYFLFVGRLEKIKGLQTLIPIFRNYEKAQLFIVGIGDYEPVLRRLAGDSPNINFLRFQSGEKLRMLYEQAVATIVPSLWYEIFGIVILEAFGQGTPVIVRNRGGMPKIVEESGGGFIYDTDEELVSRMDQLINDSALREELGRRGYEALQKKWHPDPHIQRYLDLIGQIPAK
jgi:glycosyltransferase involved in cell wall biosynthesis